MCAPTNASRIPAIDQQEIVGGRLMNLVQNFHWTPSGRNSLLLLLARVIQMANGFVLSIILVKLFGLHEVGTYTVATVAMSSLSLICGAGLNYSLPREHLSNQERNTVALWCAVYLIVPSSTIVAVYAVVMAHHTNEIFEIALFALGGYFFGQTNVLNTLLLLNNRIHWSIFTPLMNSVGMLIAALMTDTLMAFAAVLLITRTLANACLFARLNYSRVTATAALRFVWKGLKYSLMDMIAMLSEQTATLILANFLTRAEVGLFGLCQQLLAASDTPGWSVIQSHYPELVKNELGLAKSLRRNLVMLSILMAILLGFGSYILGIYVYKIPSLDIMMLVLALSVPWRYLNNFYDQVLRASGRVRACTRLAMLKFVLSIMISLLSVAYCGVWGAVFGLAFLSILSSLLYGIKATSLVGVQK